MSEIVNEKWEEQFYKVKELAEKKHKEVPDRKKYDCVDIHYFYALASLFQMKRLGAYSDEILEAHTKELKNRYISDKGVFALRLKCTRIDQDRKMSLSEVISKLIKKPLNIKTTEVFNLIFDRLIPCLTDEVTGRKIKENAGFYLITGCKLTDDEIKEMEGMMNNA